MYVDKYFPVLDEYGFCALKGVFGGDADIELAARTSYGKGTRGISDTRNLLRYLLRHHHCYHQDMEVLTSGGWKKWKDCKEYEEFVVPDENNRLKIEKLKLLSFDYDGKLFCFKNQRMSYMVTPNHKLYFQPHHEDEYKLYEADKIGKWGHFKPIAGYRLYDNVDLDNTLLNQYKFIGFYLGDGYLASTNTICFRIQKQRKLDYLNNLISDLNLSVKIKTSLEDGDVVKTYTLNKKELEQFPQFDWSKKAGDKHYDDLILSPESIYGLYDGLVNSDGSIKKDRPQIEYSSKSIKLINLFQLLTALQGKDSHLNTGYGGIYSVKQYGGRTSLESRKQYHYNIDYQGKVFCTTSSTGLLLVRGEESEFSYVCGNSSPYEFVQFKFHISCPIFVARQWIRHRMSSTNELSARYSVLPECNYFPEQDKMTVQSTNNKQGRSDEMLEQQEYEEHIMGIQANTSEAWDIYNSLINDGVAREVARTHLPLSTYTEFYWSIDLHNLLHFLKLRCDSHAQWEIRAYANIIAGLVKECCPLAFEAWYDYSFKSFNWTRLDQMLLQKTKDFIFDESPEKQNSVLTIGKSIGMSNREVEEFLSKLKSPTEQDFTLNLSTAQTAEHYQKIRQGITDENKISGNAG